GRQRGGRPCDRQCDGSVPSTVRNEGERQDRSTNLCAFGELVGAVSVVIRLKARPKVNCDAAIWARFRGVNGSLGYRPRCAAYPPVAIAERTSAAPGFRVAVEAVTEARSPSIV